jgi:hypothetical protein
MSPNTPSFRFLPAVALALAACAAPPADPPAAAEAGVKVFKARGAVQCAGRGTAPEAMRVMNASNVAETMQLLGLQARQASRAMARSGTAARNQALRELARLLRANVRRCRRPTSATWRAPARPAWPSRWSTASSSRLPSSRPAPRAASSWRRCPT